MQMSQQEMGRRIQVLRERCGLSLRRLAEKASVAPGMISFIERGKNSPSIATLQKILAALDTDLRSFFGGGQEAGKGPVIPRERMRLVSDRERTYTIVFPQREDVHVEMIDERYQYTRRKAPFETLDCDVAGYVLSGSLVLEIKGRPKRTLRPGDAFYVPGGTIHRGYTVKDDPARLITVYHPARY